MTKASWQIAADRAAIGEPVTLLTITPDEGKPYTVTPRKYTVKGQATIEGIAIKKQAGLRRDSLRQLMELDIGADKVAPDEGASEAKKAEAARRKNDLAMAVLADAPPELFDQSDLMRATIMYGIASHTMEGEGKAPTDEWIDSVFDYPELANEIVAIARAFNRPLAPTTGETSGT